MARYCSGRGTDDLDAPGFCATDWDIRRDAVEQFNTGWVYSAELADFAVEAMLERELVGNGPNATIGDFDDERLADMVAKVKGVYEAADVAIAEDVSPGTVATNQFIDPAIGMN